MLIQLEEIGEGEIAVFSTAVVLVWLWLLDVDSPPCATVPCMASCFMREFTFPGTISAAKLVRALIPGENLLLHQLAVLFLLPLQSILAQLSESPVSRLSTETDHRAGCPLLTFSNLDGEGFQLL